MGRIAASAIALALVLCTVVSASTNVAPLWNQFAGTYNFDSYPTAAGATFGESYNGSHYVQDIVGIVNAINEILVMPSFPIDDDDTLVMPSFPIDDDDTLNETVENWPF